MSTLDKRTDHHKALDRQRFVRDCPSPRPERRLVVCSLRSWSQRCELVKVWNSQNLAKFSLSRSFLYPHSLFFPTTLKKPNSDTSVFSKNFLKTKKLPYDVARFIGCTFRFWRSGCESDDAAPLRNRFFPLDDFYRRIRLRDYFFSHPSSHEQETSALCVDRPVGDLQSLPFSPQWRHLSTLFILEYAVL